MQIFEEISKMYAFIKFDPEFKGNDTFLNTVSVTPYSKAKHHWQQT